MEQHSVESANREGVGKKDSTTLVSSLSVGFLLFFTAANVLGYFDRYIVHAVEPLLKIDLKLTNSESALLTTAFVWGYFVFSPVFGYLGDRYSKPLLMGIGIFVWSIATGMTGLATTFTSFFIIRTFVGFGEASFGTIAPGYLKGLVRDPVKLNKALGVFYAAIPFGAALGYAAGGKIAGWLSWHYVFFFAAVPGLLLAPGFFRCRDVRTATAERPPFVESLRKVGRVRILWFAIGGYILNSFALNGIAPFIVRYGHTLGFELERIQFLFGMILLVTGSFGTLVGSRIAAWFASRASDPIESLMRFVGYTTLLGVPFLIVAFLVSHQLLFLGCCFFAQLMLFAGVAPVNSVIVDRAPEGLETLTQGVTIFLLNLLGNIGAAFIVGLAADAFLDRFDNEQIALAWALQITSFAMFAAGSVWLLGGKLKLSKVPQELRS